MNVKGVLYEPNFDSASVGKAILSIETEIYNLRTEGTAEALALANILENNVEAMKHAIVLYGRLKGWESDWKDELSKRVEVEFALARIKERRRKERRRKEKES